MAHVFFEKLEKRRSTQTLFSTLGSDVVYQPLYGVQVPTPLYGIQVQDPGMGNIILNPNPISSGSSFGFNFPYSGSTGGFFPWSGGYYGMSGLSPYSSYTRWTNPFNQFSPWNSWGGFGSFFSPMWGLFGGLFGGSSWSSGYNPGVPDIRLLYGIFPPSTSTPGDIITYYGIGIPQPLSFW